jgi:hypothetical protein
MGFRTVVILYNDQASEWEKDAELGRKIAHGMNDAMSSLPRDWNSPANLHYGNVMACEHADNVSLFAIDSYYGRRLATGFGAWQKDVKEVDLQLLKTAAEELGYRLVKKA